MPFFLDIMKPMGIVAVSPQDVACTSNPCNFMNGGCQDQDICVYNENYEVVCECGPGKIKQSADGQCVMKSSVEGTYIQSKMLLTGQRYSFLNPWNYLGRINCDAWTCKNGRCVNESELCNGINNCGGKFTRIALLNNRIITNNYFFR